MGCRGCSSKKKCRKSTFAWETCDAVPVHCFSLSPPAGGSVWACKTCYVLTPAIFLIENCESRQWQNYVQYSADVTSFGWSLYFFRGLGRPVTFWLLDFSHRNWREQTVIDFCTVLCWRHRLWGRACIFFTGAVELSHRTWREQRKTDFRQTAQKLESLEWIISAGYGVFQNQIKLENCVWYWGAGRYFFINLYKSVHLGICR